MRRNTYHQHTRRNIFVYYRASAGDGAIAHLYRSDQHRVTADKRSLTDDCSVLQLSVIINGNDARADIYMLTYGGIPCIAEVVHIRLSADIRVFHFREVAHAHAMCQVRSRAAVAEGAHAHVVFKSSFFQRRTAHDAAIAYS